VSREAIQKRMAGLALSRLGHKSVYIRGMNIPAIYEDSEFELEAAFVSSLGISISKEDSLRIEKSDSVIVNNQAYEIKSIAKTDDILVFLELKRA
jgi:hypothetical protein